MKKPAASVISFDHVRKLRSEAGGNPQPPNPPTVIAGQRRTFSVLDCTRDRETWRWIRGTRLKTIANSLGVSIQSAEEIVRQGVAAMRERRAA